MPTIEVTKLLDLKHHLSMMYQSQTIAEALSQSPKGNYHYLAAVGIVESMQPESEAESDSD